jgi:hypothetical protein
MAISNAISVCTYRQIVPYCCSKKEGVVGPPGWDVKAQASAIFVEPWFLFAFFSFCFLPAPCWNLNKFLSKPDYWAANYRGKSYASGQERLGANLLDDGQYL